ncbi:MAG TPA: HAD family hydrolase [Candidatus Marinimicrobia bacterium]|nr:HAD family hydrolase [Candidatus Neomarinimicrobiota bacterium]
MKLEFWDFDGVIKDSVEVKTRAFMRLFRPYGAEITHKVRLHHESNGGMSRFEKLPLYLSWTGERPSEERVKEMCERFGRLVFQEVIDSPWVPGAENYLRMNSNNKIFILVSATPQDEIEQIVKALNLFESFKEIYGAPTSKKDAVRMSIERYGVSPADCMVIGDAQADMDAAQANGVPFMLRLHGSNREIFRDYTGTTVEDFTHL